MIRCDAVYCGQPTAFNVRFWNRIEKMGNVGFGDLADLISTVGTNFESQQLTTASTQTADISPIALHTRHTTVFSAKSLSLRIINYQN
jgi:hypothetical protein